MFRSALFIMLVLSPVVAAADPRATAAVSADGFAVEFKADGELVTRSVHSGKVRVEKGTGTKPLAKPYYYPLNAPGQVPVTRDWPLKTGTPGETTDHFHQKSLWFCHGDVIPEGIRLVTKSADKHVKGVDFWSEAAGHGRIVCTEVSQPEQVSPGHVRVRTVNQWRTPDGRTILDEVRTIGLELVAADAGGGRLLTFDIALTAAVPVTFGDTKEGSFGVRVSDAFAVKRKGSTGIITSATGKTAKVGANDNLPVWGEEAAWHDYSGTVDGKPAGVAIFDAPTNPHKAAWHTRAYGLMAANPFGRAESGFPGRKGNAPAVKLAKGEELRLRYGVYVHAGDAAAGKVAAAYDVFKAGK